MKLYVMKLFAIDKGTVANHCYTKLTTSQRPSGTRFNRECRGGTCVCSVATAEAQNQMQGRLLLNVVVRERAPIFELLAREDQPLLVGRNALLVLDLGLHIVDRVRWLHLQRDGLASKCLDKNLHPPAQTQHQMQRRLLLDIVVRERAAVLELLAREDQPLLVRRDALFVLDLGLHIVDRVGWLHLERDGLASERLDEDLHPTAQAQHQMQRRY